MNDYDRLKISDIAKSQLNDMLVDKIEELHMDCGLKMDASIAQHTVKKMVELLGTKYKSWCWGEFTAVCRQGITGVYGTTSVKINFQALATWMKKAELARGAIYASRNMTENEQFKTQDVNVNYNQNGRNWGPVMYLHFEYALNFNSPKDLKSAILNNQLPQLARQGLEEKYPYVLTVGYPL